MREREEGAFFVAGTADWKVRRGAKAKNLPKNSPLFSGTCTMP
jgi:hypothetical protein